MARKTNKEIRQMSIIEAENYAKLHPAESGRISKELAKASAKCAGIQIHYTASGVFPKSPNAVTVTF